MITLVLPYCPSVNNYKAVGRIKRTKSGKIYQCRFNTKQTMGYFYEVYLYWHQYMQHNSFPGFADATISVEVDVYPPDKRKRDLDGVVKVLLDSMQHAKIYDDDCQISRLLVTRMAIIDEGKIIVRIKPYVDSRTSA
jgi:crossover junction endodeoxyribonuclease RusA